MGYPLCIVLGALIGAACCPLCYWLERLLSRQRGLEFTGAARLHLLLYALMVLLSMAIMVEKPTLPQAAYAFLLLILAELSAVMDIRHRVIPNDVVLALMGVRLLFGIPALCGVEGFPSFNPWMSLAGLAACFVIFSLPALWGKSVGAGDIKLAAAIGFCLELKGSLAAVIMMGVLVLGYLFVKSRFGIVATLKKNIPMGPFLSAGVMVIYLAAQAGWLEMLFV